MRKKVMKLFKDSNVYRNKRRYHVSLFFSFYQLESSKYNIISFFIIKNLFSDFKRVSNKMNKVIQKKSLSFQKEHKMNLIY